MKFSRRLAAAVAAPLLAAGLALAASGPASASVGPVQYTPAGTASISGYYAHALSNAVNFTHETAYAGSDGHHTIEQLPVSTISPGGVKGAAGIALCNQQTGAAAQLGLVYMGGGKMDVVAATGVIPVPAGGPYNGDNCQDGLLTVTPTVIKAGIPDNDTVVLDIRYDFRLSHTVFFAADDLGNPGVTYSGTLTVPSHTVFNEADAGAISDTQHETALSGTPPYPNPGCNGTLNCDPRLLEGFSHVTLSGNVVGGHEQHSNGSLYASGAWDSFPVASSASGQVFLGPTVVAEDHFLELVGQPVI